MNTNLLPGLLDEHVEMFVENDSLKVIQSGKVIPFAEVSFPIIELLKEEINKEINVKLALHDMHPTSEIKRIEQFAKCRFGGLDFKADIENGVLQDGEFWACPMHGNCPHEGTLCKLPTVNEYRLNKSDIKLMQMSSTEMTNEVIAEELGMALGTFHKEKSKIHQLLGVQTKQGITKFCSFLNLI